MREIRMSYPTLGRLVLVLAVSVIGQILIQWAEQELRTSEQET